MKEQDKIQKLRPDQLESVHGGNWMPGRYEPGAGSYQEESKAFFRKCVGEETYVRAMHCEAGRRHHYVVARAFLNQADWEKFTWIERYGSLDGYPE